MADGNGPLIVRRSPPVDYTKPGVHSYNANRRSSVAGGSSRLLQRLRVLLFVVGLCGIGYYVYTVSDAYIYQAYQNWAFDQEIAGRRGVTFADYVRERTPFGFLAGPRAPESVRPAPPPPATPPEIAPPAQGALLGRVEIGRLNLAAMVREGVDAKTLAVAVGHVPSTALPGQSGNFAIAAHRDTLFRVLKDIRKGDLVTFRSPTGSYTYQVLATKIVRPSDVSVLRSDGGGLISPSQPSANGQEPQKLLTMITCYPFYYVGSAPKRFIVEARLIASDPSAKSELAEAEKPSPREAAVPVQVNETPKPRATKQASVRKSHRALHISRSLIPPRRDRLVYFG